MTPRRRAEDRLTITKSFAGIVSALVIGAVSWNFLTLLDLAKRVAYIEWFLKAKGIVP